MKKVFYIVFLFSLFITLGCNSKKENKYTGSQFIVPDSLLIKIQNADSNIIQRKVKVIVTINGDCDLCFSKLKTWNNLLKANNTLSDNTLFIFNIVAFDYEYVIDYVEDIDFSYPTLYSHTNELLAQNNILFQKQEEETVIYNTLLVNPENKIEFIGNPIESKEQFSAFYLKLNGLIDMSDISNF